MEHVEAEIVRGVLLDQDALDLQVKLGDTLERTGARGVMIDLRDEVKSDKSAIRTLERQIRMLEREVERWQSFTGVVAKVLHLQPTKS